MSPRIKRESYDDFSSSDEEGPAAKRPRQNSGRPASVAPGHLEDPAQADLHNLEEQMMADDLATQLQVPVNPAPAVNGPAGANGAYNFPRLAPANHGRPVTPATAARHPAFGALTQWLRASGPAGRTLVLAALAQVEHENGEKIKNAFGL
jgi:hypothetical protein